MTPENISAECMSGRCFQIVLFFWHKAGNCFKLIKLILIFINEKQNLDVIMLITGVKIN